MQNGTIRLRFRLSQTNRLRLRLRLRKISTSTLILTLTLALSLCSVFAEEQKIVVSVNGVNITEAEVQMAIDSLIPRSLFHRTITSEKREQFRKPAIDAVIENELLYQEGKRLGLKVARSEVKGIFNKNKESFKKKKDFYNALKRQGFTEDSFKRIIERGLMAGMVLKQEVGDKAVLTESDMEKYYNENMEKFVRPEGMRLREMSINVSPAATSEEKETLKKKAEDLLNRLKAGEDFSELAYNYSEDAFKVKGGDLGIVHKGRLEPEIEDAALKLKDGEISRLIETTYGFHIIKLEGREPEKQLSFSEAKDTLKKDLETKKRKELKETLINRLKEKAKIVVY